MVKFIPFCEVKNSFKLLEYGHAICHSKAPDPEISNMSLFRENFKFRYFMDINIFHENHKSVHEIAKFEHFVKVIHIRNLKITGFKMYIIIFQKFEIFSNIKNGLNLTIFAKLGN